MRLPFLWVALGFSVGIALEKYGVVPAAWMAYALGAGVLLLWFLRGCRFFLPLFILLLGCAGFLWARLDVYVPANAVENFISSDRVTLRGTVVSLPEMKTRGRKTTVSLVLKARSITTQEGGPSRNQGGRRKFRKVDGEVQTFLLQSPVLPQVGDDLRLYGKLSAPRTVLNPGEFDYGNFLAQKKIHAVFQTIGRKSVRLVRAGSSYSPSRLVAGVRRRLAILIDKLYGVSEASILKALVLGLRSDVTPEVRNQFMKTGTIHLFATANTKRDFAPFPNKIIAAYSPQPIGWQRS